MLLLWPSTAKAADHLAPDHLLLRIGEGGIFRLPFEGQRTDYVWASFDERIATVGRNGYVRATGPGLTTVTASNGSHSATAVVFVKAFRPSMVSALALDKSSAQLGKGENMRLVARTAPDYALDSSVYFVSTDSSIASVDNTGMVAGISRGEATIYAYTADWSHNAACTISVDPLPAAQQVPEPQPSEGTNTGDTINSWLYVNGDIYNYYNSDSSQHSETFPSATENAQNQGNDADEAQPYSTNPPAPIYADNGWRQDEDGWRYFSGDGHMATGWVERDFAWYFFDENGLMQTGWLADGNNTYYLRDDGVMQVNWQYISGPDGGPPSWYIFKTNGAMYTGWYYDWQHWYYFNKDGTMDTGWLGLGGDRYFLYPDGHMATLFNEIDGETYYFRYSGRMVTGWHYDGAEWFLFGDDGKLMTRME